MGIGERQNTQIFSVGQNYPNPFHQFTVIEIELFKKNDIHIMLSTPTGQIVYESVFKQMKVGKHRIPIDGNSLSDGIYFYSISNGSFSVTKKMMVD